MYLSSYDNKTKYRMKKKVDNIFMRWMMKELFFHENMEVIFVEISY